ncbi:hypothetical protein KC328_g7789, partial [Hortaea werneckii]
MTAPQEQNGGWQGTLRAPDLPNMSRAVSNGSCKGNNIAVFSGGSAANSLVDVFDQVRQANACSLSYIIPVSDNGGSSSELIRVFGGPGIGD